MTDPEPTLNEKLTKLLNGYENDSNTPDFILAQYLVMCLGAYNHTIEARARWYGRMDEPGRGSQPYPPVPDHIKKLYAEGPVFLRSDNHP